MGRIRSWGQTGRHWVASTLHGTESSATRVDANLGKTAVIAVIVVGCPFRRQPVNESQFNTTLHQHILRPNLPIPNLHQRLLRLQ